MTGPQGDRTDRGPFAKVKELVQRLGEPQFRGLLLDLLVFVLNLWLLPRLADMFLATVRGAAQDDQRAQKLLFGMTLALLVLAPVGATLKRWHHHRSLPGQARKEGPDPMSSCWFNPIFYFCTTALIFATANAFVLQSVYGRKEPDGNVFVLSVFFGIGLMVAHTVLVYRYFSPPKAAPKSAFLRHRASGVLGDAFLFGNMIAFQLVWNLLATVKVPPTTGVVDFVFRLLVLGFLALLLYFPPRMFYLADDIGKLRTWMTILQANLPILVRVLMGSSA